MPERVSAEYGILEFIEYQFCRRVVVALNLVAYHLNLLVYLRLRIRAVEHDVGEQVDGACEVLFQYCRMIHRVFLVCEGVDVSAHPVKAVEDLD